MQAPIPKDSAVFAIDPGNFETAYCVLRGDRKILGFGKLPNLKFRREVLPLHLANYVAVEMIASYGMPVGREVFETCINIGRINAQLPTTLIVRQQVKLAICKSPKANDSTIRCALIDLFGAPGKKSAPGPTYGITADCWAALALAETFRSGEFEPYTLAENAS